VAAGSRFWEARGWEAGVVGHCVPDPRNYLANHHWPERADAPTMSSWRSFDAWPSSLGKQAGSICFLTALREVNPLAKPNFQFQKRQKELEKKRKQEEKRQRKLEKTPEQPAVNPDEPLPPPGEVPPA